MFTGNTRDSSGVNPEGKAWGIYIWTVSCVTRKHWWGGLTGLYHCWHTNHACRLYRVLFSTQTGMLHWATSGSRSPILLIVSHCRSLHGFCAPWPCYILPPEEVWMVPSQVPLTPGQSQVINLIAHDRVWRWAIDWNMAQYRYSPMFQLTDLLTQCVLTNQFADSTCSNCTICWPGRYSRFTQCNHRACLWFVWLQWYKTCSNMFIVQSLTKHVYLVKIYYKAMLCICIFQYAGMYGENFIGFVKPSYSGGN